MIRQPDARTAEPPDLDAITTTITLAFAEDPVWGPAMGAFCAIAGSFFPAQQARAVRVSEVFSKVA